MKIASVKISFIVTTVVCLSLCMVLWMQSAQVSVIQASDNMSNMGELFAGELIKLSLEQLMSMDVVNI